MSISWGFNKIKWKFYLYVDCCDLLVGSILVWQDQYQVSMRGMAKWCLHANGVCQAFWWKRGRVRITSYLFCKRVGWVEGGGVCDYVQVHFLGANYSSKLGFNLETLFPTMACENITFVYELFQAFSPIMWMSTQFLHVGDMDWMGNVYIVFDFLDKSSQKVY